MEEEYQISSTEIPNSLEENELESEENANE